ncbi:AraC family transcriptional regulator [Streptomyces sp. NPDC053474]|uniref:AraC family transcriptional regulator n=1 Tax=Streptomyces sp. NPDC053474 TaxID=3365704 RepID=UPI0037D8600C
MIQTVFRSEDVPAQDRFDCWRELAVRTRRCDVISAHAADYRAELRLLELGPVTVWRTSIPSTRFLRSASMARRSDSELYHLTLMLKGGLALNRSTSRTSTVGPRGLCVMDGSRPYDVRSSQRVESAGGAEDRVEGVAVDFPKVLLPLPPHRVRELLGRGLSGREGMGAVLADFLTGLVRQAPSLRPSDAPRLGTVVLDLVSVWLAQLLDAEAGLPEDACQQALAERIRAFIRENLHDPELTPGVIADAHRVSLSYLHRVFTRQSDGETVAAWIRARRLELAHRDLADPLLLTTPIREIAARWGMPRASAFTRAFRAAYGVSPREHRHRSLTGEL